MTSSDDLRSRFLDELIASTRVLSSIDSAAVAEAWASSAVAEWSTLGGAPGELAARLASSSSLGAGLIEWIDGGEPPDGTVEWISDVGCHELRRASRIVDASTPDEIGWIFEYVAPSGDQHDLSATIVADQLVGLSVGPAGLAMAAFDDTTSGFRVQEVPVDEAITILAKSVVGQRCSLSESAEATVPLLARRLGINLVLEVEATSDRTLPERHVDDDRYAADVLASALRAQLGQDPADAVHAAHDAFVARVAAADPDAMTLFDVAGITAAPEEVDLDLFVRLVGAYFAPASLEPHTDAQFAALIELEPADWIGVVLGLTRASVGTEIDGDTLVRFINKAPEITTTIPKGDAPRIAWTFEQMLFSWEVTGVLDGDGRVSETASWLLPRAALAALGR